ncbi:hypothetical protein L6164_001127 [Bauhinia variegata]|uniref:Uncharacterized protein n=1 Tax=Bauhinia variegata TaxID=167791 RepID=A0ACB9Q855_BAUVA|nr:hypothetical protein L6164_001127 [Bauhinia variegata]
MYSFMVTGFSNCCEHLNERRIEESKGKKVETLETNLLQKTPSSITEGDNNSGFWKHNMKISEESKKQVLPFYFVKAWPKDTSSRPKIKDSIRLFEEEEQHHFHKSEKIRKKMFDRDQMISKLRELNNYVHSRQGEVSRIKAFTSGTVSSSGQNLPPK